MRWFGSAGRRVCGLALVASGLMACSDGPSGPSPGVATVAFTARPVALPYMTLTRGQARLNRVLLIGNVPPPPPPDPSPRPPPPDDLPSVDLDAVSSTAASAAFEDLPQGLYSRVRFMIGRVSLEGTWKGTVFNVSLAPFGTVVDVRASMPQELGLDQDINFQVSVDPNIWFPPYLLDNAMLDNRREIVVDDVSNPQISATLIQGMAGSFWLP